MTKKGNDKRRLTSGDRLLDVSKDISKQGKSLNKRQLSLKCSTLLQYIVNILATHKSQSSNDINIYKYKTNQL